MVPLEAAVVVLVPFPFSDLSQAKLRPALVLAAAGRDDWILCQITSNAYTDPDAVELVQAEFRSGSLRTTSFARPGKLFTASGQLVTGRVGKLTAERFAAVLDAVIGMFENSRP